MSATTSVEPADGAEPTVAQMTRAASIAFFLVPGLAVLGAFELAYGPLVDRGVPAAWATFVCLWSPVIVMAVAVLARWRGSELPFDGYFMARPIRWRTVGLVVGLFLAMQALELLLEPTRMWLSEVPGFGVPQPFPDLFRPGFEPEVPMEQLLGVSLAGNPSMLAFWALWLLPNIMGEELLWRGYALPRMQDAWGERAWVVNGLLWNLVFHAFMRWSLVVLLPVSLLLPWLAWRHRSWWPGVVLHGLGNVLLFAILIPSVLAT